MLNRVRQRIRGGSVLLLMAGAVAAGHALAGGDRAVEAHLVDGRYACVDPATGQLVSPDESSECRAALEAARDEEAARAAEQDKDAEALEEQPLEGGGAKVDLQGEFHQNQASPGRRIAIIDPATGRLVSGAAAAAVMRQSPLARQALQEFEAELREMAAESVDDTGLQEQEIETGGMKVDLQGRFRSPLVARVGADGTITTEHAGREVD